MTTIYVVPWAFVFVVGIACGVALACGGHVWVRRAFPQHDFISHNEVAGYIYAIVGVLYAVLLGFVVVVVWQQYNESDQRDRSEVGAVSAAWHVAIGLPALTAAAVRADLDSYAGAITGQEWPAMQHGGRSEAAERAIDAALLAAVHAPPHVDETARAAVIARLTEIADDRRHRLDDNETGIPPLLWTALVLGGGIVVAFAYVFGLPNFRVQLLMTGALAAMIAALFVVIAELDYPFRGDTGISPHRWVALVAELHADPR